MIFGFYHITMRTLSARDLPYISDLPPGTTISQKVKIAHVVFVPLFPLGLVWAYNIGDEMYKIDNEKMRDVEERIGKRNVPWYSFAGIIVAALFFVNQFVEDKIDDWKYSRNKIEKQTMVEDQVANPTENAIFYLKDISGNVVPVKVRSNTKDSISFLAPVDIENEKWERDKYAHAFFLNDNLTQNISFSKAELITSLAAGSSTKETRILVENLPNKRYLSLNRIENPITEDLPFVNVSVEKDVKESYSHFRTNLTVTDTFFEYIDQASTDLFKIHLENAYKSHESIVADLQSGFYPNGNQLYSKNRSKIYDMVNYKLAIFTKQLYLKGVESGKPSKREIEEDINNYRFFIRLLDFGFYTMDDTNVPDISDGGVIELLTENHAVIIIRKKSNMINVPTTVTQEVDMFLENGKWKINLPSTVSYFYDQVRSVYGSNEDLPKEYRALVRANIKEMNDGETMKRIWGY